MVHLKEIWIRIKKLVMPLEHNNTLLTKGLSFAWLRTAVALIGLGFVVSRFGLFLRTIILGHSLNVNAVDQNYTNYSLSSLVGISMVILGIVFIGFALRNYLDTYNSIIKGSYLPKHIYIYLVSISLIVLGALVAFYLLFIPLAIK